MQVVDHQRMAVFGTRMVAQVLVVRGQVGVGMGHVYRVARGSELTDGNHRQGGDGREPERRLRQAIS